MSRIKLARGGKSAEWKFLAFTIYGVKIGTGKFLKMARKLVEASFVSSFVFMFGRV
jgi:hypothetical protein